METPVVQKLMTELVAHLEVRRAFVGAALSCYPDDIDDVVQNANLAVIRRVDDFDPARPLLPWLIAFAKRQILAFRSKRGAERLVFDEAALERLAETYVTCDSADLPVMTRLAICKRKLDEEYDETPCSAAGTVFLATGSETAAGSGEIVVANGELTNGDATAPGPRTLATLLPGNGPRCDGNAAFRRRSLSIRDYGRVKLTDSFRVSSLSLEGANAALNLNGKTLSTLSLNVNGQEFRPGTYTAAQIGPQVTSAGSVVVGGQGFRIIIR